MPGWVQLLAILPCDRPGHDNHPAWLESIVQGSWNLSTSLLPNVQYMAHCDACHRPRWSKPMNGQKYCGLSLDHIYLTYKPIHTSINSLGWCKRNSKTASRRGAGFWPLAGCSASQPLPKMWEDWIAMDPNGSHPKRKDSNRFDLFESFWNLKGLEMLAPWLQDPFLPSRSGGEDLGCVDTVMNNWKKTARSAYSKAKPTKPNGSMMKHDESSMSRFYRISP